LFGGLARPQERAQYGAIYRDGPKCGKLRVALMHKEAMTATNMKELPLPPHFEASNAERWEYRPDQQALFDAAQQWRREHDIQPAAAAARNVHLLIVDMQKDFCFPEGTLYVGGRSGRGAIEDSARLASFIYRNLENLTDITTTMDTHFAYQIFFASFWLGSGDIPLSPYRTVTAEDIKSGEARPNPDLAWWLAGGDYDWLLKQAQFYCEELEREGKYTLYLWPPHCVLGSEGHSLVGVIHEARLFFSFARGSQSWVELKGDHPLTEHYSVFRPEVTRQFDGSPLAEGNQELVNDLLSADALIIAGEASSHCVKNSVDDLLGEIEARDPSLASKVYLLTDCMSAVTVPDGKGGFLADFTPEAEAALARYAEAGMHLVRSTEPMESWPGLGTEANETD